MRVLRLPRHGLLISGLLFNGILSVALAACGGGGGSGPALAPPTLMNVAPASGPMAGGMLLTLMGSGFSAGPLRITVGGAAASDVSTTGDALCMCRTPPSLTAGTADVVVVTPAGSATLPSAFTYVTGPALTRVEPSAVYLPGNVSLTLTGSGFMDSGAGMNIVDFGGSAGTGIGTVDDATVMCTSPVGTAGFRDVTVTNTRGTATLYSGLTYYRFPPVFTEPEQRMNTTGVGEFGSGSPEICCEGNRVHVLWGDNREGKRQIFYSRSTDAGRTWMASDLRLDAGLATEADATGARIVCSGENVYAAWLLDGKIYLNSSTDAGATWRSKPRQIPLASEGIAGPQIHGMAVSCEGRHVYVIWLSEELLDGGPDSRMHTRFQVSQDAGETWFTSAVRLDSQKPDGMSSADVGIASSGNAVYAVWRDSRSGRQDVYFRRSADRGSTWIGGETRLDSDGAGNSDSLAPRICCSEANVYVAWDESGGRDGFFFNHSEDGGTTWQDEDTILETLGPDGMTSGAEGRICCSGNRVYAVWLDDRHHDGQDVQFTASSDRGATWQTEERMLNVGTDTESTYSPWICCAGEHVFAAWDATDSGMEVYLNASKDSGATFQTTPTRISTHASPEQPRFGCRITCCGPRVHVAWTDYRGGEYDDVWERDWINPDVYVRSSEP